MRPWWLLLLVVPAASALAVESHDDGQTFYFTAGTSERNPTLEVVAGQTVTLEFTNHGTVRHNFRVFGQGTDLVDLHKTQSVTLRAPETPGDYTYTCSAHPDLGMSGTFRVLPAAASSTESKSSPLAPLVVLAALALATYPKRFFQA